MHHAHFNSSDCTDQVYKVKVEVWQNFNLGWESILNNAREVIQSNNENNFYTDYCTMSSLDIKACAHGNIGHTVFKTSNSCNLLIHYTILIKYVKEKLQLLSCLPGIFLFS